MDNKLAVHIPYRSVCELASMVRDLAYRYVAGADIEDRVEFSDRQYAAVIGRWQGVIEEHDLEATEQDLIDINFRREWERFQRSEF